MDKKDCLFRIADSQQGYFTNLQAEKCGYVRANFQRNILSGEWIKEQRGIYRLARYPITDRPELVVWSLWSRSKKGEIQGVWSHETALDVYELSDVMPSKMHMTVPKTFRKIVATPSLLVLHYSNLQENETRAQQGYLITTPLRTLIDVVEEGALSQDLVLQALQDALKKGIVLRRDIEAMGKKSLLRGLLNEL